MKGPLFRPSKNPQGNLLSCQTKTDLKKILLLIESLLDESDTGVGGVLSDVQVF